VKCRSPMPRPMPNRRADSSAAMSREESPADIQLTRAFIAVAIGFLLAMWVLRPMCTDPNVRTALPELRALSGVPTLVI
jgi:hypothetical protein